jgi:NADPH:quinone reductase-like Zn-dependent oxidoreductase
MRFGGHIALIGVLSGPGTFNPISILMKAVHVQGVFVGSRAMFEDMNRLIVGEGIRPVIDRAFPINQSIEAFKYLESSSHFGKVVVKLD